MAKKWLKTCERSAKSPAGRNKSMLATTRTTAHRVYTFGEFVLDADRGQLLRNGGEVRLRPQSFEVLHYLVEHHGRLVSRDKLMTAIWGDTVVTDGSLTQCIIDVRKAIGDESRRMIRTVPRRGFVFDFPVDDAGAPVEVAGEASPGSAASARWRRFPAAVLLLVLAGTATWLVYHATGPEEPGGPTLPVHPKSVAVLPFVDMSAQKDQEYFSEGMSEEILNRLARAPELQVIARTSSFSLKGENADIAAIAEKLRVAHVLEGSVRKSGNRVRVTAQLVNASNSVPIWSQSYDGEFGDILTVQNKIATAVADALEVALKTTPLAHEAAPTDVRAYELLLQARFFHSRRGDGDIERAENYYRQALSADPGFARAWAGLAGIYLLQAARRDLAPEPGLASMREAVEQALRHDPSLAEAHVRAATYHRIIGDTETALSHRRTAQLLAPNDPLVLATAAGVDAYWGLFDEAIAQQSRAVELDPLSFVGRNNLAVFLLGAGRLAAARAEFERALEINPDAHEVEAQIAFILILQQQFEEALAAVQRLPDGPMRDKGLALLGHSLGRQAEADKAIERLMLTTNSRTAQYLAEVYAWRGEIEQAFRWVAASAEEHRRSVWSPGITDLRVSPFLEPLRDDPRWSEILTALNDRE
jgi:TolB-like protein/DNA-binding winged helix-turn-helix (wHTH) protein/Tfp pilus assembly protein PilF